MEELSNPKLYLTLFGSVINVFMIFIDRNKLSKKENKKLPPLTFSVGVTLFASYIMVGVFTYIFFYEDIQKAEQKIALTLGLGSYLLVSSLYKKLSE